MKIGKKAKLLAITLGILLTSAGITYAAFYDRGKVKGATFSVGSADIKLLINMAGGTTSDNLADELIGPTFGNIASNWQKDYALKIYNNASSTVTLTTKGNYETANDPNDLRSIIYVEPILWNDVNNDGIVDSGEKGAGLGKKTIIKWKSEGFSLGQMSSGETKGFVLSFSTTDVSDTKQGSSAIFDFEFNSTQVE